MKRNIVLIGMPSSGKSTLGVLLAKTLSMSFIDTDLLIQVEEGRRLCEIQNQIGMAAFRLLEGTIVKKIDCENSVIATGGSVVYGAEAMAHLRNIGKIVFLDLPLDEIEARIGDPVTRGVVMQPGMTIADLYKERRPLYEQYADQTLFCGGKSHDELLGELVRAG